MKALTVAQLLGEPRTVTIKRWEWCELMSCSYIEFNEFPGYWMELSDDEARYISYVGSTLRLYPKAIKKGKRQQMFPSLQIEIY